MNQREAEKEEDFFLKRTRFTYQTYSDKLSILAGMVLFVCSVPLKARFSNLLTLSFMGDSVFFYLLSTLRYCVYRSYRRNFQLSYLFVSQAELLFLSSKAIKTTCSLLLLFILFFRFALLLFFSLRLSLCLDRLCKWCICFRDNRDKHRTEPFFFLFAFPPNSIFYPEYNSYYLSLLFYLSYLSLRYSWIRLSRVLSFSLSPEHFLHHPLSNTCFLALSLSLTALPAHPLLRPVRWFAKAKSSMQSNDINFSFAFVFWFCFCAQPAS